MTSAFEAKIEGLSPLVLDAPAGQLLGWSCGRMKEAMRGGEIDVIGAK
jgi:hypothetical protein